MWVARQDTDVHRGGACPRGARVPTQLWPPGTCPGEVTVCTCASLSLPAYQDADSTPRISLLAQKCPQGTDLVPAWRRFWATRG